MSVRDTSIAVYNQIKAEGLLSKRRWEVYNILYNYGPLTANQVFKMLNVPTNQSGRITELQEMGIVTNVGKTKCPITSREVYLWDVTSKLPEKHEKDKTREEKKKEILEEIIEVGKMLEFYPVPREKLLKVYYKLKKL